MKPIVIDGLTVAQWRREYQGTKWGEVFEIIENLQSRLEKAEAVCEAELHLRTASHISEHGPRCPACEAYDNYAAVFKAWRAAKGDG